jgi:hypothetical protein
LRRGWQLIKTSDGQLKTILPVENIVDYPRGRDRAAA